MPKTPPRKRSPITAPVPRQAGQALREKMDDYLIDNLYAWVFLTSGLLIATFLFWWAHLTGVSLFIAAIITSALFLLSIPLAYYKICKARSRYQLLRQGMQGEQSVGALLEELRQYGYRLYHDVPDAKQPTFNIDHVAIGPAGVIAFETKAYSIPTIGDTDVRIQNNRLIVPGLDLERYNADPLAQAARNAEFLRKRLGKMTKQNVTVAPVLLFPGRWVVSPAIARIDNSVVHAMNPKQVFAWLADMPARINDQDIALYADRIELHLADCYD